MGILLDLLWGYSWIVKIRSTLEVHLFSFKKRVSPCFEVGFIIIQKGVSSYLKMVVDCQGLSLIYTSGVAPFK